MEIFCVSKIVSSWCNEWVSIQFHYLMLFRKILRQTFDMDIGSWNITTRDWFPHLITEIERFTMVAALFWKSIGRPRLAFKGNHEDYWAMTRLDQNAKGNGGIHYAYITFGSLLIQLKCVSLQKQSARHRHSHADVHYISLHMQFEATRKRSVSRLPYVLVTNFLPVAIERFMDTVWISVALVLFVKYFGFWRNLSEKRWKKN